LQGTSNFFQEGNWTETPENNILQVPILSWACLATMILRVIEHLVFSGMVLVRDNSIKFFCMNLMQLERYNLLQLL
jgi:hypothetical protein